MKKLFSITLLLLILCGCGDDEVNLPFTEPETDWNLSYSEMESRYQDIITETFFTEENLILGDFGIPGGRLMGVTAFLYIEKNGLQTRYYFNEERKLICSQIMINTDEDIYICNITFHPHAIIRSTSQDRIRKDHVQHGTRAGKRGKSNSRI